MPTDPDAALSSDLQNQAPAAQNRVTAVNGIDGALAADAQTYGPQVGVHPDVALHMVPEVKQQAQIQQRQVAIAASPPLQQWINGANDAQVAAAQDSFPHLAYIGNNPYLAELSRREGQAFQGLEERPENPFLSILNQAGQATDTIAELVKAAINPNYKPQFQTPEQQIQSAFNNLNQQPIPGVEGFGKLTGPAFAPVLAGLTLVPGKQISQLTGGTISPETAGDLSALVLSAVPFLRGGRGSIRAGPIDLGQARDITERPPGLPGPPEGPPPEVAAEYEPSPYVSAPRGVDAATDVARNTLAEIDAGNVAQLQEQVAKAPVFSRSPDVVESFIQSRVPSATVAVDPEALLNLTQEGHEPFPERAGEIIRAVSEGSDVEIPLARYITATAGQPFAEQLNKVSTFRDGGTSLEDAKISPLEQPGIITSGGVSAERVGGETFTPVEEGRLAALEKSHARAATDALRASYLQPLFQNGETLGLSKDEFARYSQALGDIQSNVVNKMQQAAMRAVVRERAPEFKEAATTHAERIKGELENLPGIKASRELSQPGFKLDRDMVENFYPGNAPKLPSTLLKQGGNHPDNAAEQLGYGSGAELVQALADIHESVQALGARNLNEFVTKSAKLGGEAAARNQFGYDLSPDTLYDQASELVHSPETSRFLVRELKEWGEGRGLPPFDPYEMDRYIETRFNDLPVKDAINSRKFNDRVYRLGNKVQQALQKGNDARAFAYRQAQYIQHQLAQKSFEFARQFKRQNNEIANLARARTLSSIDQGFLDRIHQLLGRYGFSVPRDNIAQLSDPYEVWAANMRGAYLDIPEYLPQAGKTRDLSVDDFNSLYDVVKTLKTIGENEKTLFLLNEQLDMALAVKEALENSAGVYKRPADLTVGGGADWKQDPIGAFNALSYDPKTMIDTLDNRNPNGIFNRTLTIPGRAATVAEHDMLFETETAIKSALDTAGNKDWSRWNKKVSAGHGLMHPVWNDQEMELYHSDVMSIAAQMGNELSRWHLEEGGWGFQRAAYEKLVSDILTAEDWNAIKSVADGMEKSWPQIVETEKALTGLAPEKVPSVPFELANGMKFDGWYWPLKRNEALNSLLTGGPKVDPSVLDQHFFREGQTPRGHTIRRTRSAYISQLNWLDTIRTHFPNIAKRIAYGQYVVNGFKFLRQPEIAQLVNQVHGPHGMAVLEDHIQRQIGYRSIDPRVPAVWDALAHELRMRTYSVLAGFKISILVEHATSAMQTLGTLGTRGTVGGYLRWAVNPLQVSKDALEASNYLRIRSGIVDRDMRDILDDIQNHRRVALPIPVPGPRGWHLLRTPLDVPVATLNKWASGLLQFVNHNFFAVQAWTGAYHEGVQGTARVLGRKLPPMTHDEAVNYADAVVAKSHGSGFEVDMTRWQSGMGSEVMKLLTEFNIFRGTIGSRAREGIYHTVHGQDMDERIAGLKQFLAVALGVSIVGKLVADNGPKVGHELEWLAETLVQSLSRLVPLGENLFEMGDAAANGRDPAFQLSPTEGAIENVGKGAADGIKKIKGRPMPKRSIVDSANALGFLLGAPLGQLGETLQAAHDISQGGVQHPVQALAFGPSHERAR